MCSLSVLWYHLHEYSAQAHQHAPVMEMLQNSWDIYSEVTVHSIKL